MSLFQSNPTNNIFNNQPNINQGSKNFPQQSGGLFSVGQNNNQNKSTSSNSIGIFGSSNLNQTSNTGSGIFSNNQAVSGIFNTNTNTVNQNNQKNNGLSTPMKNNNLSSGTTNIFGSNPSGNNSQNTNPNIFGNTATGNINSSTGLFNNSNNTGNSNFQNTNPNVIQNNTNSTNQAGNNIFQNQTNTAQANTAVNQIFNQNASINTNSLFGQPQSTNNQTNSQANNVNTSNPNQNTSNFSLFGNNNGQTPQQSNQISQQGNTNQSSLFNQGNTANPSTSTTTQNLFGNPQPQQNSTGNLMSSSIQNNQNSTQNSLFAISFLSNPSDTQNKEIKILTAQTMPNNSLFGSLGQTKTENNPATGGLFASVNPTGSLFENKPKTDSSLTASLFTSLNQASTSNKIPFGDNQNPSNITTENRTSAINAPSNILGINLESLSENVKKACRSENKSIKDFIQDVEKEFQKEDFRDYYRKIPTNISTSYGHGYKGIEEYHERQRYQSNRQISGSRDKMSEFDFYKNFSIHNNSSRYTSRKDNLSLPQTKMSRSPEKSNNYNFNRNVMELSLKVRNNIGSKTTSSLQNSYIMDEKFNEENICDNLKEIADTSLIDIVANNEIPNGANINDKVIEIIIEYRSDGNQLRLPLNINKNNNVALLRELIKEKLKQRKDKFLKFLDLEKIVLMKQNTLMKDSKLISEYKMVNGTEVTLLLSQVQDDDYDNLYPYSHKNLRKGKFHLRNIKKNEVAPLELVPTLTLAGYKTSPDFKILCRMTLDELRNVDNFSIWNEYGKIEWKESVDLTELDLDRIVEIGQCVILVYQSDDIILPPRGEKLNKPSIFTFNNIMPEDPLRNERDRVRFEELLKNLVNKQGGKFVCYDYNNFKLVFECDEFKKQK